MYITNSCTNSCVYCGFNCHNKFKRVILTMDQIKAECEAIKKLGPFENLLIVTGENPAKAGAHYQIGKGHGPVNHFYNFNK